jgi:hypothetical protein
MRIEILERSVKSYEVHYEVRVVDADGTIVRTFTYPKIERARKAARAWTAAYGNCRVDDLTGLKE